MPYCNKKTLSFLLTTGCNLACKYCYGSRKAKYRTLDINFAKCAIDEYIASGRIGGIRFFGDGEPTTEMRLLKEICNYARSCNPNVRCEIQTNGVFNREAATWLAENMDEIWISMDLLPDTHDMFRVTKTGEPTSPIIEGNMRFFQSMPTKRAMVGVRATITNYNIDRQEEGIDYLHSFGIKYIWVDPIFAPVEKEGKFFERINLMHFAHKFVDARKHAHQIGVFYESNFTTNFDGPTIYNCRACLPMPHLTMDGYVSACEMCTSGEEAGDMQKAFIYGQYDAENNKINYFPDKIKMLRSRELKNMAECQDCLAKEHCAGFCLGETQNEKHNLFKIKDSVCKPIRFIYSQIGKDYEQYGGEFKYKHP